MKRSFLKTFDWIFRGVLFAGGFFACTFSPENQVWRQLSGKDTYLTSFPPDLDSDKLENLSESVILVNSITYYKVFYFPEAKNVTITDLKRRSPESYATELKIKNEPSTGTGLVIQFREGKMAFLTCHHVVIKPDSVWQFYTSKNPDGLSYIRTLAIKLKFDLFLPEYSDLDNLSILASDKNHDIAIIGQTINNELLSKIDEFKGQVGNSEKLKLGTLAYHFGYPATKKQLTTGLITIGKKRSDSFISDAVINRGYSGGPVFAYRFNSTEPDWIGMTRSAPVHYEWVVSPMEDFDESVEVREFSDGKLLIKRQTIQHYGTANIISINTILDFLNKNQEKLQKSGYNLGLFKSSYKTY